jgi:hypothetical protein
MNLDDEIKWWTEQAFKSMNPPLTEDHRPAILPPAVGRRVITS